MAIENPDFPEKGIEKKTKITPGAVSAAALIGTSFFMFGCSANSADVTLSSSDVTSVARKDIVQSINANGTIAPEREVALTTSSTAPIKQITAQVGDRVTANQLLATLDTSAAQRDLASQRATQQAESSSSLNSVRNAQLQLQQAQESLERGMNPEINSAQQAVSSAQHEFENAKASRAARINNPNPQIQDAENNVRIAREAIRTATNRALQSALSPLGNLVTGGIDANAGLGIQTVMDAVEADAAVADAHRRLADAEQALNSTLAAQGTAAAEAGRAEAGAFLALRNAEANLAIARYNAENQIATHQQALNQALDSAAASRASSEAANAKLEFDIANGQVITPVAGIVTAVNGKTGQPSPGTILTVADDSNLRIQATVREADLARIKEGDEVTFTSPSAPDGKYTGRLSKVSGVAAGTPSASGENQAQQGKPKADFPIEITVTGNRDGLRLGSTAKMNIIVQRQDQALTVPLSAIGTEQDGSSFVLVLHDGRITKKKVAVGTRSDFDVAITGDIKDKDTVLSQAERYKNRSGETAAVVG